MTPKEKAFELFNKYKSNSSFGIMPTDLAKQCALIAVDEIINIGLLSKKPITYKAIQDVHEEYWQEVIQEIEKL